MIEKMLLLCLYDKAAVYVLVCAGLIACTVQQGTVLTEYFVYE